MSRTLTRVAAALALAVGSAVAVSTPASAAARMIACPGTGSLLFPGVYDAWADVQARGHRIDVVTAMTQEGARP